MPPPCCRRTEQCGRKGLAREIALTATASCSASRCSLRRPWCGKRGTSSSAICTAAAAAAHPMAPQTLRGLRGHHCGRLSLQASCWRPPPPAGLSARRHHSERGGAEQGESRAADPRTTARVPQAPATPYIKSPRRPPTSATSSRRRADEMRRPGTIKTTRGMTVRHPLLAAQAGAARPGRREGGEASAVAAAGLQRHAAVRVVRARPSLRVGVGRGLRREAWWCFQIGFCARATRPKQRAFVELAA